MDLVALSLEEIRKMHERNELKESDLFVRCGNKFAILRGLSPREKIILEAFKNFIKQ